MASSQFGLPGLSLESELIGRAIKKDETAIRAIIQANNRRLYRVARSVVRDDSEAEDVLQEAYLRAFAALGAFRQDSSLATWLTRIVLNEALQRARKKTDQPRDDMELTRQQSAQIIRFPSFGGPPVDPERAMAQREIFQLMERAIDGLPDEFRTVLVARVIEDMSIEETAQLLGLLPVTVKTRLHRARRLLKAALADHIGPMFSDVFPFDGERCGRLTNAVIQRLAATA
jgi:RNA polymerase sigma-70 factor, ECF subfamily